MKNFKFYILAIFAVGFIANSCKDIVQYDEGDNKTDEPSTEKVDKEKSKSLALGDVKNAKTKVIETNLNSKSDSKASGDIVFTERTGQVKMEAKFSGLKPGTHAIHLHENANCSSKDGKTAGGHWNPTNEKHGKWGDAEGYHKGDIGNFEVDEEGNATVHFETSQWCIACDDSTKNIIGRSVVVHQGGDDFISQPAGDAGKRVGCSEIKTYVEK
ncbi:MAG TPA: superoxide dismutase family protein [Brumimicrobium sp.]|nr:superoxide dismutase family protein [Brumimicrobium sp.]